jgi:hypothetical protein
VGSLRRWIAALVLVGIIVAVISISNRKKSGEGWEERGGAHNNLQDAYFVMVDKAHMKNRAIYDQAAHAFCPASKTGWPICQVVFYAPGDLVPPPGTQVSGAMIPEGYRRVLAIYATSQDGTPAAFGAWDCERAGEAGAPASALCGRIRAYFDAVSQLSLRASRSVGCGWARYDADIEGVRRFIQQVSDAEQRALYERTSALFYGSGSTRPN